jgi:hypothetical protein
MAKTFRFKCSEYEGRLCEKRGLLVEWMPAPTGGFYPVVVASGGQLAEALSLNDAD